MDRRDYDLHSTSSFGKSIDDQLLVLFSPLPHVRVCRYHRSDIIDNVLVLSDFVMERQMFRQMLESISDVNLGPTCDAKMEVWAVYVNELL